MATIALDLGAARVSRRTREIWVWVWGVLCAALVLLAAVGTWLAPYAPDETDVLAAGQGPTGAHWFGTDALGRDVLSRALVGARLSFVGPGIIVVVSSAFGTALAIVAAWNGGWIDRALNRLLNVVFAVPAVLVAVLASAVVGAGFWGPVTALALVYTPYCARVVRSAAVQQRTLPYVEGLELAGISTSRICSRHLLLNVAPIVLAQASIAFGSALIDFAAVSFIGLGVQPPTAEWGVMVADGRSELLDGAVQQSLVAGTCIVITVVAFNAFGDRLAARLGGGR